MVHSTKTKLETKKILDIGKYRLRARAGWYCVLIGESNVAIDPAIGGYGVADIYLGVFSPQGSLGFQKKWILYILWLIRQDGK